jgi:hypothetical protein
MYRFAILAAVLVVISSNVAVAYKSADALTRGIPHHSLAVGTSTSRPTNRQRSSRDKALALAAGVGWGYHGSV